ncbi:NADH-quinone oxidoreductase subunit J [Pseudomarimonas arenosa]|uniref:NADH-quinone oxidoreductase subunit J n=1 Tax=Pseudomarimonas arenosa TaxID=2774145 RepID=A0AAW3ZNS6_9GAMM|nr:NADH-quinone oxidoreductase subunit J [Pseudomarimonas arenosa]MBD8526824.1 NADH-quinone oxidoreductase subunit J [Pseudomarimonas arenosa]
MEFTLIAFYLFAAVTAAAALGVVTARNMVHATLLLVLTFFSTACIWLLAQAEFLAIALVLVYVGAVMVLFLFVVMMLDIKPETARAGMRRHLPVALIVAGVMAAEMLTLLGVGRSAQPLPVADPALAKGNTYWIGKAMFTDYLYPFEIAAVILTVAIIAAIMLTLRRRPNTKHQDPSRQVMVRRDDRVRLVKVDADKSRGGQ